MAMGRHALEASLRAIPASTVTVQMSSHGLYRSTLPFLPKHGVVEFAYYSTIWPLRAASSMLRRGAAGFIAQVSALFTIDT